VMVTRPGSHPDTPSFPTRRSSDLLGLRMARSDRPGEIGEADNRDDDRGECRVREIKAAPSEDLAPGNRRGPRRAGFAHTTAVKRSEEHTSELQSRENLVCRLLLEK